MLAVNTNGENGGAFRGPRSMIFLGSRKRDPVGALSLPAYTSGVGSRALPLKVQVSRWILIRYE